MGHFCGKSTHGVGFEDGERDEVYRATVEKLFIDENY